jgi:hypothetical protein
MCLYVESKVLKKVTATGCQLKEVGDFGAKSCLLPLNLIQSTKLEFSTFLSNEAQTPCLRAGDVGGCRFCF